MGSCWHLTGKGRGCCLTSCIIAQTASSNPSKELLGPKRQEWETPFWLTVHFLNLLPFSVTFRRQKTWVFSHRLWAKFALTCTEVGETQDLNIQTSDYLESGGQNKVLRGVIKTENKSKEHNTLTQYKFGWKSSNGDPPLNSWNKR